MSNTDNEQFVYIVDVYDFHNKAANSDVVQVFTLYENYFCIRKVSLRWGVPDLKNRPIEEDKLPFFHIYDTLEEAQQFVKLLRQSQGIK